MSNVSLYMIGVALVIAAIIFAASMAGLAAKWLVLIALVGIGIGLMVAIVKTRQKERP